jgi:hypothetical protein
VAPWGDDGFWEDNGAIWGTQLTIEEIRRILRVLDQTKAAHTLYNVVLYVVSGSIWGEALDELWSDDGEWEDSEANELYRRHP